MKTPIDYENFVAIFFEQQGYKTELTPTTGDYGVDVIAIKDKERIAIQAKMYGDSSRKVNAEAIIKLNGAIPIYDCTKGILVTDGELLNDAQNIAKKLNIKILYLPFKESVINSRNETNSRNNNSNPNKFKDDQSFQQIWTDYIKPLKGKTLTGTTGLQNKIIHVDEASITRITKNGKSNTIPIEPFKWAYKRILDNGQVTRDEINQNFVGRLSSGVVLIMSNFPNIKVVEKPLTLKFISKK